MFSIRSRLKWLALTALLAACGANAPAPEQPAAASRNAAAPAELTESDVLGVEPGQSVTEEDIAKAAQARNRVAMKRGASIMLIQAGANVPDESMLKEAALYFSTTPFTGIARSATEGATNYSRALRLAAAKGGHDFVVCYWNALESALTERSSKQLVWSPIRLEQIPDEAEFVRVRHKVIVLEVKTGQWTTLNPETLEDKGSTRGWLRRPSDRQRIAKLKESGHKHAVQEMLRAVL